MSQIKLNERISFLRKQRNMTQEELAQTLGVSNQSVSKWESAQCCPDIQLLPDIAKLFGVSIDELMGCQETDSFENIYLKIKSMFESCPAESVFQNAFRLSILLHEAVCSKGYKEYIPWDAEKNHGLESILTNWGFSAYCGTEGTAVYAGNGIFMADYTTYTAPEASWLHELQIALKRLKDKTVLTVLYALYELTIHDFDLYVSVSDIAAKAMLTEPEAEEALEHFPVTVKEDNGKTFYRIAGSYMHVPALLLLLREK